MVESLDRTSPEPSLEIAQLREQMRALEQRCSEAEEALDAIRTGSVDALVIYGEEGEKIYTIQGADYAYRVLVESINEGAVTLVEDGTILYCNRRFAEMLNAPLESLIGASIFPHIDPGCRARFSVLLQQGLTGSCREEISLLCDDGSTIPILASLNTFNAHTGSGACLVAYDLTERKKVEELTREEARRAEMLSEVSQSLIEAGLDIQAIPEMISRYTALLVGDACVIRLVPDKGSWLYQAAYIQPDLQVAQDFAEVFPEAALHAYDELNREVQKTGKAMLWKSIHRKHLKATGQSEDLDFTRRYQVASLLIVPVRTRVVNLGTLMLFRFTGGNPYDHKDRQLAQRISNQMALAIANAQLYNDLQSALFKEQSLRLQSIQTEKLSAMSRMMASLVHEINNPLQMIKNCVYLAKSSLPEASQQADYLNMAYSETDRIGRLVSKMREIYHPPTTEPKQPLNLVQTLADVRSLLDPYLSSQNIAWQQLNCDQPMWIDGTVDQIKQVFLNICMNAIEAMQPDGGTIKILIKDCQEDREVVVSIQDTGPGIDPGALPRLFEPFFTTKETGTGLGLTICYEIIQRHGGHIDVESFPGNGATFNIWLPTIPSG